ncbi:hypothetical protein ACC870_37435, partial [Rhizobium ruizarguesonis]
GRGILTFAKGYIEKAGAQIVGEEYLPMDCSYWTAIISKVRSSGADAIITSTAGGAPNVTLTDQEELLCALFADEIVDDRRHLLFRNPGI